MKIYGSFTQAIEDTRGALRDRSSYVAPGTWQSVDVSSKPEMGTYELLNHCFQVPINTAGLDALRADVQPNLPWADDHFLERVGGQPLNPGEQWKRWPYAHSADKFRDDRGQFSHTYMERHWPKRAGQCLSCEGPCEHEGQGIRYMYGDTMDVVDHLVKNPFSRQAYLPIWFPEDTGVVHGERVPCTLGYHFIRRGAFVHVSYFIRSCDFTRHFRDDIYLTVRLLLWVIEQCQARAIDRAAWDGVMPGMFTMFATSMHMFRHDYVAAFGQDRVR
jgi:hypothetical protein